MDCIIDMHVTDLDCKANLSKDPHKVLAQHERAKKKKYLEACTEQRRHFSPFTISTDDVIGKEARTRLLCASSQPSLQTSRTNRTWSCAASSMLV
jgi:hypothetical protein